MEGLRTSEKRGTGLEIETEKASGKVSNKSDFLGSVVLGRAGRQATTISPGRTARLPDRSLFIHKAKRQASGA